MKFPENVLVKIGRHVVFACFAFVGLWVSFLQMFFFDDAQRVVGSHMDSRLIHINHEHVYRFFFESWPKSFWTVPWLFFPEKNSIALSDNYLTSSLMYIPWRLLGMDEFRSFQMWQAGSAFLLFYAMYLLLRRMTCSFLGSLLGAYLYAFAAARSYHMEMNAQAVPHYFTVFSLLFLVRFHQKGIFEKGSRKNMLWAVTMFACQVWASFYVGVFYSILVFFVFVYFVKHRELKAILFLHLRQNKTYYMWCAILLFVLLLPMALPSVQVFNLQGKRRWGDIVESVPTVSAYFIALFSSTQYSFLNQWEVQKVLGRMGGGHFWFGLTVWILAIVAMVSKTRNKYVGLNRFLFLGITIVTLNFFGHSLWYFFYKIWPGASVLRLMGRIIFITLIPLSFLVAVGADHICLRLGKFSVLVYLGLAGLIIIENWHGQIQTYTIKTHVNEPARLVGLIRSPANVHCKTFYYRPEELSYSEHIDAMWASMISRVPTLNGYSASWPIGYQLQGDKPLNEEFFQNWFEKHGLSFDPATNCVLH